MKGGKTDVNPKSGVIAGDILNAKKELLVGGTISTQSATKPITITSNVLMSRDLTVDGNLNVTGSITQNAGTYDVIICGGGTAACVAANVISSDINVKVLVLEAGKYINDDPVSKYPYASNPETNELNIYAGLMGDPDINDVVKNKNVMTGQYDLRCSNLHAGGNLGGASMHNFLFAVRPDPSYHNYVSTFAGAHAADWNGTACSTIYQNMETYIGPPAQPNRGYSGPMQILQTPVPANPPYGDTWGDMLNSLASQSLDAGDNATAVTLDYNNDVPRALCKSSQSFLYPDANSPIGVSRSSAAQSYMGTNVITPQGLGVGSRSNLTVIFNALVLRVLFDSNKNAIGVEALVDGVIKVFLVNKKVIVSAGSLRSPGILERSGIGNASSLVAAGIPPIVQNPNVGENMSDHQGPAVLFTVNNNAYIAQTNPIALLAGSSLNPYGYPRQYIFNVHNLTGFEAVFGLFGGNNALLNQLGVPADGTNSYLGFFLMVQPTTRSSIHVTNTNPNTAPKLLFNIANTTNDIYMERVAYQHIKRVEADLAANHPSMGFTLKYPPNSAYGGYPSSPTNLFTASISGTTLTVTILTSGTIVPGMTILEGNTWSNVPEANILQGTQVVTQLSGSPGGVGTYTVNKSQTVTSRQMHGDMLEFYAAGVNIINDHYSGTCRMGDKLAQQGVVDGQLHVYDVNKVMVADNSIWPVAPNCNSTLAAMLVGQRAGDICLATI